MFEMTNEHLDEIRERAVAATHGPWRVWDNSNGCTRGSAVETAWSHDSDGADTDLITDWCVPADAEFIAAAREDVPALLAEVDRLTAALKAVGKRLDQVDSDGRALTCTVDQQKNIVGSRLRREVKKLRSVIQSALEARSV